MGTAMCWSCDPETQVMAGFNVRDDQETNGSMAYLLPPWSLGSFGDYSHDRYGTEPTRPTQSIEI